jgi:hypothetical protein
MKCTLLQTGQTDEHGRFIFRCEACGGTAKHRDCDAVLSKRCGQEDPPPDHGPGTELTTMIRDELGVDADGCKRCKWLAREMDRVGVDGVRRARDYYASRLRENADNRGWGTMATAAVGSLKSGLALRLKPWDLYGSLVDEACRRAQSA